MTSKEKNIRQAAFASCADLLLVEIDMLSVHVLKEPEHIKPCLRAALKALETVRQSVLRLGGLDDNTAVDGEIFVESVEAQTGND